VQSTQAPLNTEQLEQLVAPIALYPDALVAQVLAAATYPAQVVDADHWRQAQGYAPPEQIVAGANVQNWDPSVKALTAVPQLLAEMDQNVRWTMALGNAYYNQPQDVLDVVQVMRQRAQAAGNLQSTPQEAVSYDQGYIQVAPANPQVVYLPAYDPWTAYGAPVQPYRGFSLSGVFGAVGSFLSSGFGSSAVRFGSGIAMSAFSSSPWGLLGWGLDWLSHMLLFNHSGYYSHSTTVADWGLPHGGPRAYNRGYMQARGQSGGYRPQGGYAHTNIEVNGYQRGGYGGVRGDMLTHPSAGNSFGNRYGGSRPVGNDYRGYGNNYARPAMPSQQAYNRMPAQVARPQQQFSRPAPSYGGSGLLGSNRGYDSRPAGGYNYGGATQGYRAPSYAPSYSERASNGYSGGGYGGRGFEGYSGKAEKSGGSHMSGGGKEFKAPKAPKAPKMDKSFSHSSHGEKGGHSGGGHSGGHGGGHHR
jgi:hypothetical protein